MVSNPSRFTKRILGLLLLFVMMRGGGGCGGTPATVRIVLEGLPQPATFVHIQASVLLTDHAPISCLGEPGSGRSTWSIMRDIIADGSELSFEVPDETTGKTLNISIEADMPCGSASGAFAGTVTGADSIEATVKMLPRNLDQCELCIDFTGGEKYGHPIEISPSTYNGVREINNHSCYMNFKQGSNVLLNGVSNSNVRFAGWSGDCTGTAQCQIVVDGKTNLGAAFVDIGP